MSERGDWQRVSVIVLAYGDEPLLRECVSAILGSVDIIVDVVLVDNGCFSTDLLDLGATENVTVIVPGKNTGFAGGCNLGVKHATAEHLAFINSDAVVEPDALAALITTLEDTTVGLASGSLRLYDRPEVINSAGNPIHYLGLSWAGGLGEPAEKFPERADIAGATGAALACTRETWDALGGFCEPMFAYAEDADLSLRCWQSNRRVVHVPDAVVLHRYEFSRNPNKMYLMERNRLFMVLTVYEGRTLALLMPALLGLEVAVLAMSAAQGWWAQKIEGWCWLLRHRSLVKTRRAEVQAARVVCDGSIVGLLTSRFDPGTESGVRSPRILTWISRSYWAAVRPLIR